MNSLMPTLGKAWAALRLSQEDAPIDTINFLTLCGDKAILTEGCQQQEILKYKGNQLVCFPPDIDSPNINHQKRSLPLEESSPK